MNNIFEAIPADIPSEIFEDLIRNANFRLERIVSHGHASPDNEWYDQDDDEWVLLIEGSAQIEFQTDRRIANLTKGSILNIPAHSKHRVNWTQKENPTIWLTIHY
ncbi:cupin [Pseudomonadota bacterium]